eukprot:2623125-Heterocapsa_arctica.AAC.1
MGYALSPLLPTKLSTCCTSVTRTEALTPNFEELDRLFPGIRKRVEDYDPRDTNNEEELLLMPYLFHLHTHSEEVGLRILNPT